MSTHSKLAELLAVPGGLGPEALPDEAAPWFSLEERVWFALRRACARSAEPAVELAREEDLAEPAADRVGEPDDALLSSLSDAMLAALIGLRPASTSRPEDEGAGEVGARLVEQLSLAGVTRPQEGFGAWEASTRSMLWTLRLIALATSRGSAPQSRMRAGFDAVERWLRALLGSEAQRLDAPERIGVVPQVALALLGAVEREAALESRLVAAIVAGAAGIFATAQVSAAIGEALLEASEPEAEVVEARAALCRALGVSRARIELARFRCGTGDEAAAQASLRGDVPQADAVALVEALFAHLVEARRTDEAVALVIEQGERGGLSSEVLRVALRQATHPAVRRELARVLEWHGCASLDGAEAWLTAQSAVERARRALDEGRAAEALRELRRVTGARDATLVQAQAHEALGQHERAFARYEQALEAAPGDPARVAALGRAAARSGRADAPQLLEHALQMGYTGTVEAELLADLAMARGELVAAERWLELADEWSPAGRRSPGHGRLGAQALAEARALVARGELGQADGMLELASVHADAVLGGVIALERFFVRERWRGVGEAVALVLQGPASVAESLSRAAVASLTSGAVEPRRARMLVELGEALEGAHRRALWPLSMIAAAQRVVGDDDAALVAAEAGLSRSSGQIAAEVPGAEPVPLEGALARQREDACALYATLVEVSRGRDDAGAAAQASARGLAHLGLVPSLVQLAGRLLAESEGASRLREWELAMGSMLGAEGVARLIEALRARVGESPSAVSAGGDDGTQEVLAPLFGMLGLAGQLQVAASVGMLLAEGALSMSTPRQVVARIVRGIAERDTEMTGASSGAGGLALAGQGTEEIAVASAPLPMVGWTRHRIDKASDALSGRVSPEGGGERGGSSN